MQINIKSPNTKTPGEENTNNFALFNLGFRPFFLGAGVFAVVSMVLWMLVYFSYSTLSLENISASQWHAHEMLYGYSMAVIAGFLLTAVKNWTGVATISGKPLMALFTLWAVARVLFLFGTALLPWVVAADLLFGLMLMVAIAMPIIKVKQWKQLVIVSKVLLLWVGNIVFYLGCFGILTNGMQYAIVGAVLMFIGLILMIGRRVIPFFIERGVASAVGDKVQLKQFKWLDISIFAIFAALFVNVIFVQLPYLTLLFSWALFALNGYRLFNWHTAGIWQVPLLWGLYLSAWMINLGFLVYGLQAQDNSLGILALHIFTIGGIGLMTLSMMSRVALGHTGRDIRKPSPWMCFAFIGIVASVIFRAAAPMIAPQFYMTWMLLSAIFWILSFAIFIVVYAPILLNPRVDGMDG